MAKTNSFALINSAGRAGKRPRKESARELQEAAVQLLNQHQDLAGLLQEIGSQNPCDVSEKMTAQQKDLTIKVPTAAIGGSLLVSELRRQAGELGVPVAALSVRMVLDRLLEVTTSTEGEDRGLGLLLTSTQRAQLGALLRSTSELISLGAFCPKLFWHECWKKQEDRGRPKLEVAHHLHSHHILTLEFILESDEGVQPWLMTELKSLCGWRAASGEEEEEEEGKETSLKVLSTVLGVLVGAGFEASLQDPAAPGRRISQLCCSVLDHMLSWLLDSLEAKPNLRSSGPAAAASLWVQVFDVQLCGVSREALGRFFTHSLTHTLTYRPTLKVSDAIAMQSEWGFAETPPLLTSLFRKLAVVSTVDQLLSHLQQVLEIHEVNWQHVLSFLSTLLVYNPNAQSSLKELLSRLLSSAFESFDLENMITAFLLARQGALEGPAFFPSYSDWFKMSFGSTSGYHGNGKKSLVFLLKFLSDLVPFDPPQYLKVHLLHPPYVAVKHRSLLQEYVCLAKTRLADHKVSVEDMGLFEDVSGVAGPTVLPQKQAIQDVEKAVSLFESTGRISATVMEASIFRRPYYLSRFLPALLTPRVLPVKADARMSFVEALKKAGKIPVVQYSSYMESCQTERHRHQDGVGAERGDDDPVEVLKVQLEVFSGLVTGNTAGEASAQLARLSHTLSVIFPERAVRRVGEGVVALSTHQPLSSDLHAKVVSLILRSFCQCLMDTSALDTPKEQSQWAARFVSALLGHSQLTSALLTQLWELLHNQGPLLSSAHVLGLAAFVVHLHASKSQCPLVQLSSPLLPSKPVGMCEALSLALPCTTQTNMLFCARFCVAAVCYGLSREDPPSSESQPLSQYLPSSLYKKLLYLIPRLLPELGRAAPPGVVRGASQGSRGPQVTEGQGQGEMSGLWQGVVEDSATWRSSAKKLWNLPVFRHLRQLPGYQLSFSEWLATELRVQRSEDALSDPDRQEYQQWAFHQEYLCSGADHGGCEGDMRTLCSHTLHALLDLQTSLRCENPAGNVNKAWSRISLGCPLLLVSAVRWWVRLSPVLESLWARLCDGQALPEQLQLLANCHLWAGSPGKAVSSTLGSAPPLLLSACLHWVWRDRGPSQGLDQRGSLERLRGLLKEEQYRQALVFVLFLSLMDLLATFLHPQDAENHQNVREMCSDILSLSVDSSDWLLLFNHPGQAKDVYQCVTMVTPDEYNRLMPLAFYSVVVELSSEMAGRAVRHPGFLHTAVLCYIALFKLFLDGHTPPPITKAAHHQIDPSQILSQAQQFLLRTISLSGPSSLTSTQLDQLEAQCAELDPEVSTALSFHRHPPNLSPDMDFL
ncbi:Fanconi anemia group A protein [Aplochiton taeniatus]